VAHFFRFTVIFVFVGRRVLFLSNSISLSLSLPLVSNTNTCNRQSLGGVAELIRADAVLPGKHWLSTLSPPSPSSPSSTPLTSSSSSSEVVSASLVTSQVGLVAPHVASGQLVVDGVVVSCYTDSGKIDGKGGGGLLISLFYV
jgi:hypothetical protein